MAIPLPNSINNGEEIHWSIELIEGDRNSYGMLNGWCKARHKQNWAHIGNFVEGKRFGKGTTYLKDGSIIQGDITRDRNLMISGKGRMIDPKKCV